MKITSYTNDNYYHETNVEKQELKAVFNIRFNV